MLSNTVIFTLLFDINDYQPIHHLASICDEFIPDKIKVCHLIEDHSIKKEIMRPTEGHLLTQLQQAVWQHFEDYKFYDVDYEVITPQVFSQTLEEYLQYKQVMLLLGMQPTAGFKHLSFMASH